MGTRPVAPDGFELAAGAALVGYNAALHRALPDVTYIPTNLVAAGALVGLARLGGCSAEDLGLGRDQLRAGVRTGLIGGGILAGAVALGLALPATRRFFEEDTEHEPRDVAYHATVRIPVGTALAEELMFRSALLGLLARRRSFASAALVSSLAFGVWHVLPTHDSLDRNRSVEELRGDPLRRAGAVAGAVAFTTAAGLGFAWLRKRSGSVVAPVIAHAMVNVVAFVGSHWASRRAH